jgi:branched-chain amino acid transport system permease protein
MRIAGSGDVTFIGPLIVAGIVTGCIYALLATGLVVVYRSTNVLNFAYGYIVAVPAFVAQGIARSANIPILLAAVPAILIGIALGLTVERLVVRPLSGERPLVIVVATLGVALVLQGIITRIWGGNPTEFPTLVNGAAFRIAGFTVSLDQLLLVTVSVAVILAVAAFFQFSGTGLAMRASSNNREVALLVGVDPNRVSLVSWAIAATIGGIAAVLVSPQVSLAPDAFNTLMIQGFVSVVLAGFSSIAGAVVGGLICGVGLNIFMGYVTTTIPNTALFVLLLAVLLLRPNGLVGKAQSVRL